MSKRQKGRRHRRVNRTPRPVGAGRLRAAAAAPRPAVARTASQPAGTAAPAAPAAPVAPAATAPPAVPAAPVAELGRHAARTWESLRTCGPEGASLEELCAAAGYQPRTVTKHVQGLADLGLAELRGERWYARDMAALGGR
ncbi:hypothetical protein ACSNOH_10625 [Streptomyces sp. URMC 127]|uniref:hypothetical protein n=1 Tax=Streptomyces sp. URMC 127 TaxID=3423402 RepID=UPI003F1AB7E7